MSNEDVLALAGQFQLAGEWIEAERIPAGHIHETYRVGARVAGQSRRFILQQINTSIFQNPAELMNNIARVTAHLQKKSSTPEQALRVIHGRDGKPFLQDQRGHFWRMYNAIENAHSVETATTESEAYEAALAFGHFQLMLADFPSPRLHTTIPNFHNTPRRFEQLEAAIKLDAHGRVADVRREIDFVLQRKSLGRLLVDLQQSGRIPERIAHNDTKINNVLFDNSTGHAVCVVDLDTVMPGLWLHDFGDLVRTACCRAAEDERDLSLVRLDPTLFEAVARGYLKAVGSSLTPAERDNLVNAGKIITLETGIRFLTDHLEGDRYFRTHRPGHNLDRCRAQFTLVQSIEEQEEKLRKLISDH